MSNYVLKALEALKAKGLRITSQRKALLSLLDEMDKPLTVYELHDVMLARDHKIDLVSIYRILECFDSIDLIHRIHSSGKVKKCELDICEEKPCLHQHEKYHPLLICNLCGAVQELEESDMLSLGLTSLVHQIEEKNQFKVLANSLELIGVCTQCA